MADMSDNEEILADEDEEAGSQDVDLLQEHGINVADIKKLKTSGICTIKGIEMTTRKKLCAIKGFSEMKVDQIKEACAKLGAIGFMTAQENCKKRKSVCRLSTISADLDKLMDGGIEPMAITKVVEEFSTGKTLLTHTLYITAPIPQNNGYLGDEFIFSDTKNTFCSVVQSLY